MGGIVNPVVVLDSVEVAIEDLESEFVFFFGAIALSVFVHIIQEGLLFLLHSIVEEVAFSREGI